jgi:hypothetical protein
MVKYRSVKKAGRRQQRKTTKTGRKNLRRRTMRRLPKKGGYSPIGPNGGEYGKVPDSYPSQQSGDLPAPMNPKGVPIGKEIY